MFFSCRKRCRDKDDALEKIPKRDRPVVEDGDCREIFWGLRAHEEIRGLLVAIYHVGFLVAAFAFMALWLTVLGHPWDLQNASIPLLTVLGLFPLPWLIYSNRSDNENKRE